MYKDTSGKIIYSPTDLSNYMESEYTSLMDRHLLENPEMFTPDEQTATNNMLAKRGIAYEEQVLKTFKQGDREFGFKVVEIDTSSSNRENAFTETRVALASDAGVIYQAALEMDSFRGFSDFLLKDGDGDWQVWDTKLALSVKPKFMVQLCCYAEMIQHMTGKRPEVIGILLGNDEREEFRTSDYFSYYLQVKAAFLELMDSFDPSEVPMPSGFGKNGRWESTADEWLSKTNHLSLVANIRQTQVMRLRDVGILTAADLASTTLEKVKGIGEDVFSRLKNQARLQKASDGNDVPEYEAVELTDILRIRGFQLLPPPSDLDVYFDMEGFPLEKDGLEYLFGAAFRLNGKVSFRDWWACDKSLEKEAFEGFVDWAYERWQQDPSMHIYHYAPYEQTALKRLMGAYATRENEIDNLLRAGVFVDLYQVVRQGLTIGTPSYSIKYIERLYRDARTGELGTAEDSMVFFEQWRESGQPADWKDSEILKDIRDYNEDDCVSTLELAEWLRERQSEAGIAWVAPEGREEAEQDMYAGSESELLSLAMLAKLPDQLEDLTDDDRITQMLAWLLEYYRREAKPQWWNFFMRPMMTPDELWEDKECLGGLVRTTKAREKIARSYGYEYHFDGDQDSKVKAGPKANYRVAHDMTIGVNVAAIDYEQGIVVLKRSTAKPEPPNYTDLVPGGPIKTAAMVESLLRTAIAWNEDKTIPSCVQDFLVQAQPNISNRVKGGMVVRGDGELTSETIEAVSNLENSVLCIQGPPGSGKSHVSAHCIVELMRQGKRVGVSSKSHKAITNLLAKTSEVANEDGVSFTGIKIGDPEELANDPNYRIVKSGGDWTPSESDVSTLVGGTSWAFSRESWAGMFDYLFIDEAGQVSLADLVSIAPSAKNLVIVGDQMQLDHPTQGTHPGNSAFSIMEYFLQGRATIPPDRGILLDKTWRMHPDICELVSEGVYDGRLKSESHCVNRVLQVTGNPAHVIQSESGIVYIAVEHEGNSQSSEEEAETISSLVDELIGRRLTDENGSDAGALVLEDILFVAPYNMQVNLLKKKLGPRAHVGTVDKFQGQEAPVVILSMCASTTDDVPRGMEFLLSKNRLNVAISRAQSLAIVVGSPNLKHAHCTTVRQMELANFFCKIVDHSEQA